MKYVHADTILQCRTNPVKVVKSKFGTNDCAYKVRAFQRYFDIRSLLYVFFTNTSTCTAYWTSKYIDFVASFSRSDAWTSVARVMFNVVNVMTPSSALEICNRLFFRPCVFKWRERPSQSHGSFKCHKVGQFHFSVHQHQCVRPCKHQPNKLKGEKFCVTTSNKKRVRTGKCICEKKKKKQKNNNEKVASPRG